MWMWKLTDLNDENTDTKEKSLEITTLLVSNHLVLLNSTKYSLIFTVEWFKVCIY